MGNTTYQQQFIKQFPDSEEAVCDFLVRNYGLIYSIAFAHVNDAEVAQEIAQDVCVRMLLQRGRLARVDKPANWLASVTRNTAIDWIRRRQSHSRLLTTMAEWNHETDRADHSAQDARATAIREEEIQRLRTGLAQLDPADRELLILHYMDGREKKDVARIIGIHPSTAGRRMNRAVRRLRKVLGGLEPASIAMLATATKPQASISQTLSWVSTLDASKRAALNAMAAPLPIPPGTPLSSSVFSKIMSSGDRLRDSIGQGTYGGAIQAILAAGLIAGTVIVSSRSMTNKNRAAADAAHIQTDVARLAPDRSLPKSAWVPTRTRRAAALPMIGLTSSAASVKGYVSAKAPYDLAGFVKNTQGEPIPSADVTAWCQTDNGYTSFSATSDANGRYVFQKLPDSYVNLTALADGYAHATQGEYHTKLPAPASLGLDITLDRPVKMRGTVVNESGEPVPDAKVIVARELDENEKSYQGHLTQDIFVTHTDQAGQFHFPRLKPGGVALVVQHPDYAEKLSSIIKADDKNVLIKLNRGITLIGSVHDGKTTLSGVKVKVHGGAMSHRQFGGGVTTTDENGQFKMTHLTVPSDTSKYWSYSVIAEADTNTTMPRYLIAVSNDNPTFTLNMNTHDPNAAIRQVDGLRTVDLQPPDRHDILGNDDNRPIGTATLEGTVEIPDDLTSGSTLTASISNGKNIWEQAEVVNGRFRITKMPAGHYSILCYQTKNMRPDYKWLFRPQIIDLREGDFQTVSIKPGSATVKVRVKNATAKGDYYMSLATGEIPPDGYLHPYSSVATRSIKGAETITIRGVTPGNYLVRMGKGMVQNTKPISCNPGETALVEFEEAPAFEVSGTVFDSSTSEPVAKADIVITSAAPNLADANGAEIKETDSDGRFSVSMTSGTYKLVQRRPGYQQLIFHVTDHDVQLAPIDVKTVESGIAIQFTGLQPGEEIDSFHREIYLVDMSDPEKRPTPVGSSDFSDYLLAQNIKPGMYTLIARFPKGHRRLRVSATVVIPNLQVLPEQYTKIEIPVTPAAAVNLQCNAGSHVMTWQNPQFWIQDQSGMRIPIPMRDLLRNEFGLAAGKYEFGVTLDSGEEQSTTFTVSDGEADKDVVLQLRD